MQPQTLSWLTPALLAMLLYGVAQGLVKKHIADVDPARFCLFFICAKAVVNLGYFFTMDHPDPFAADGSQFLRAGLIAYVLDGLGWILYYKSIVLGPITIVGTLSAAYPATTVLFAGYFLAEVLEPIEYAGVSLVIAGCIGLSMAPADPSSKARSKAWILLAGGAVIIWGASQTIMKYAYELPNASEANMALFNTIGGALTLGVYGLLYGRSAKEGSAAGEWLMAIIPMCMMAGGDLGVIVAAATGPISLVTPITAAYPVVTLVFASFYLREKITPIQWSCLVAILAGMYFSTSGPDMVTYLAKVISAGN